MRHYVTVLQRALLTAFAISPLLAQATTQPIQVTFINSTSSNLTQGGPTGITEMAFASTLASDGLQTLPVPTDGSGSFFYVVEHDAGTGLIFRTPVSSLNAASTLGNHPPAPASQFQYTAYSDSATTITVSCDGRTATKITNGQEVDNATCPVNSSFSVTFS